MAASAAALPTGGAGVQSSSPSASSGPGLSTKIATQATSGTPKLARLSTAALRMACALPASLRKAGRSTLRKAPRVKQNTAASIRGRTAAASAGQPSPARTPPNSSTGPRLPARASKAAALMARPPRGCAR